MRSVVPFFVSLHFITLTTIYNPYKIKTMKALRLVPLFSLLLLFAACGSDNDDNGGSIASNNANSNLSETNPYTHRMEFPKVKNGTNIILVHTLSNGEINYSVEYDTQKKCTRWSCYELYASNNKKNNSVSRYDTQRYGYPQDPLLDKQYQWAEDPIYGSRYNDQPLDHGHLCPYADRYYNQQAADQTFYLTNMAPQNRDFNSGVWADMEAWVRRQVSTKGRDTLFVVKGVTVDNNNQYDIVNSKNIAMVVPKYFYMAVLMRNASGYKALGFWIENKSNQSTDLAQYVVNIDELERLTGLDFFCNLPDDTENHIESLPLDNVKRAWGF